MRARCFLAIWLGSAWLQAQPDPLLAWLDRQAQAHLDQREKAIAAIRTKAEAESRKSVVREKLSRILGGVPAYRGPLNARVTGQLRAEGYVIEKVIFESLPGFYVTGNLYRPEITGRYPALLVPAGHTQEGKPEMQVLAANLALKGYIALTYDPIGQGEREQTYLPQLGRALSGGGGNEHLELGARSMLIGQSVARYFIFDAQRAIDYLISRPDVDADRIGVTGCSGGGAITTYVGALDPRVKVAAPGCHINSFRTLFTGPTPDSEMSLPQLLSNGLDWADFFELSAPMPWLLLATSEDYFTPVGAKPVYEEVHRWYGLYGFADRVRFFVGKGPHGTPKESREEIYRWMNRWLREGRGATQDVPVRLYTNRELQVTASGHVDDEPRSRKLHQVIREEFESRKRPGSLPELQAELKRLGIASMGPAPALEVLERAIGDGFRTEQVRFESEPGVMISGKLYLPAGTGRRGAVVVIEEKRMPVPLFVQRSQSTAAVAEAMVKAGHVVLELEPRDSPAAVDGRPFLGNWLMNERADLVGRNLAAMRARDIVVAVDVLSARADVNPADIRGYARGVKGFWLMLAAGVDQRLSRIWLDRTPWRLSVALAAPLSSHLFEAMIPGFALHWDFPDLVRLIGERRIFWTDPTNWMNQVVDAGEGYRYRTVGQGDADYLKEFLP